MQTIEAVKDEMSRLRRRLDDLETVLAARHTDDEALIPVAVEQIGVLISELELLRVRLEGHAEPWHVAAESS